MRKTCVWAGYKLGKTWLQLRAFMNSFFCSRPFRGIKSGLMPRLCLDSCTAYPHQSNAYLPLLNSCLCTLTTGPIKTTTNYLKGIGFKE